MEAPQAQLNCTQCGGELHPDEGQTFLTCPFCSATVFLDKSQVVFHWYIAPTLDSAQAAAALARWMSGSQTVKDLDRKSQVTGQTFQYFPLWYFKSQSNGREDVALQPAAAISVTELSSLELPAGDLRRYDSALDAQSTAPSVPLEAARDWLLQAHPGAQLRESALVHVPIYLFKYIYRQQVYTAAVEAATGRVLANLYPAKSEAPYLLAGGITALVYLCLALALLLGSSSSGTAVIVLALALIAAPVLFAMAAWVASKV
jgi:hypothetical protein